MHRGEQLLCTSLHPQTKHYPGDRSLAYDLIVKRGIVSGRVALLLRSTEIKPDTFLRSVLYFILFCFFISKYYMMVNYIALCSLFIRVV